MNGVYFNNTDLNKISNLILSDDFHVVQYYMLDKICYPPNNKSNKKFYSLLCIDNLLSSNSGVLYLWPTTY